MGKDYWGRLLGSFYVWPFNVSSGATGRHNPWHSKVWKIFSWRMKKIAECVVFYCTFRNSCDLTYVLWTIMHQNKLVELGKYLFCLYLALKCTDHLQCQGHGDRRTGRQKDRSNAKTPYCLYLSIHVIPQRAIIMDMS